MKESISAPESRNQHIYVRIIHYSHLAYHVDLLVSEPYELVEE